MLRQATRGCKNRADLTLDGAISALPVPEAAVALFLEETGFVRTVHLTAQQVV